MAKPPSKRRGITLGTRADSASALELLNISETAVHQSDATPEMMKEQLAELRRLGADLDLYWRRQFDQMQEQSLQLEQQHAEIAQQTRQLQDLKQTQRRSRRLGVLLSLLALTSVAAMGFHTWPRLQDLASDWSRVSTGVVKLAPQLEVVHGQVVSLTSDMEQIGSDMTTLREDVSEIRSDPETLSRVAETSPTSKHPGRTRTASARTAVYTVPPERSTARNPYWPMRHMRPW